MSEEEVVIQEDTEPFNPFTRENQPPETPEPRGGCGCWLPALVTLFLVVLLVGIGAILPPVNALQKLFGIALFGPAYTTLTAESNAVRSTDGGLTVLVDPTNPGAEFGVALESTTSDVPETASALAVVPPALALQSPVYTVQTTGTAP